MKKPIQLYDVTVVDDTGIRRAIYSGVDRNTAICAKDEILYAAKRRYWNPRIRKHKPEELKHRCIPVYIHNSHSLPVLRGVMNVPAKGGK